MQFIGVYNQLIDSRNRITFPKKFLLELQDDVVFCIPEDYDQVITLYHKNAVETMLEDVKVHPEKKGIADEILSKGKILRIDKQHRLILPRPQVAHIGNPQEICLIGAYDHVVIYSKEHWENCIEEV